MASYPSPLSLRPPIMGTRYMVSTGHYLASMAAVRILEQGGNATDAGVAAGICINVLLPDMTNIGGVAPIILYDAKAQQIRTISGLGSWPQAVSREYFVEESGGRLLPGVHRCVMPAAVDSWLTALEKFGTMSLAEVAAPAIALAEDGFPVYPYLQANLEDDARLLAKWESNAAIYLPNGAPPKAGERLVQRDLAGMLRMLVEAEEGKRYLGREAAIRAARDRFYTGDIAERIAAFFSEQSGFLTLDDLKNFSVEIETPLSVSYRGYDIYGCRPWSQGPVALQTLSILEGYDIAALGQNSADSLHLITEALKAAFADRHHYYGDPKFVDVPVEGLLSPEYAAEWRKRISLAQAAPGMPEPGNPWPYQNGGRASGNAYSAPAAFAAGVEPDTSYVAVVDEAGNAFSATPSDGVSGSPIIPGLGFIVSSRGVQSWLEPDHPSVLAPGKRPRLTPNPGLIMKDGQVFAPYGTPGNDVQPQAMVQFVLNMIDFGLDPQQAVEAPRLATYSYPQSSDPHPYTPGKLRVENRIPADVMSELSRRGHQVEVWPDWAAPAGSLCSVVVDRERAHLIGAADPRRVAYAIGW